MTQSTRVFDNVSFPPRLGEHTGKVLQERLGMDENQIETLLRSGILTV